jgi:muramoyltetrapeptide carboxypeptidase
LEASGFNVRVAESARARHHYLAGSDSDRLHDLTALLLDDGVNAIVAARGGYGSGRLLPAIEPGLFRLHPKPIVGYSDFTFVLNDIMQRAELVTFHGPMVCGLAEHPARLDALVALLCGDGPATVEAPAVIREGAGEGILAGGCLSILTAMVGTPYALETAGRILLIEDVNEPPYRIDRMLTHLKQAGALDAIAGIVFGEMPGCFDDTEVTIEEIVVEICDGAYPIVTDVPFGHGTGSVALPLGVRARLDGARLTLLEPAIA